MKFLTKICAGLLLAALAFGLAACGDTDEGNANGADSGYVSSDTTTRPGQTIGTGGTTESHRVWTIEELGETITAAGIFWEDWWGFGGVFALSNSEQSVFVPTDAEHPGVGMGFTPFLPASGFVTLDDVRDHLLQFYTEDTADNIIANYMIFTEIDGVVHFADARYGMARPRWDDATFALIEQVGNRAVVEATFLHGGWHRGDWDDAYPRRAIHRFVMIDGKIDVGLGPFGMNEDTIMEMLPLTAVQMGRRVASQMHFWHTYWNFEGQFGWVYNICRESEPVYDDEYAVYLPLLPASGIENMEQLRWRLTWHYTNAYIDRLLAAEHAPFREINGQVYINVSRMHTYRPDWETATHEIVFEDGLRQTLETTVTMRHTGYLTEEIVRIRFVFVDGQIDEIIP